MLRPELLDQLATDTGPGCDVDGCTRPALYAIVTAGPPLAACLDHFGPMLTSAAGVQWPPRLVWLGTGDAPPSVYSAGHICPVASRSVHVVLGIPSIASRIA
ncbi:MAG: hypothetical protein AUG49_25230 [Catenulispora sp. 13_1_20CM_3_70_7]|nr:MAG: hypothetical protein AUG49_25230 [Catenulispora sp. 13_1_20CM_3_70_7]